MPKRASTHLPHVGWREWVRLPDLCPTPIKVKVDTGARTSALHAFGLHVRDTGGSPEVRFEIHPHQRSKRDAVEVICPVAEFRKVRSSTGHTENRPVIRIALQVGEFRFLTNVTLTSRDAMGFRMLLGRSALRRRFVVDPGQSYLLGRERD